MRLLICAGCHFKDAERLRLALDQCHGLQPVALLGHLLHAGSGLPDEAERWCRERGADSRAYDYPERSGSDNALREYGEAILGDAAPDLVLVFPGGRLASELVQVAHAADVPLTGTGRARCRRPADARLSPAVGALGGEPAIAAGQAPAVGGQDQPAQQHEGEERQP
ncbi:TPA: hypothetical protein NJH56_000774 [Pseudomonas aeruginosa]|nr:hypothetical protein [Pseudomonas aeruginosa]